MNQTPNPTKNPKLNPYLRKAGGILNTLINPIGAGLQKLVQPKNSGIPADPGGSDPARIAPPTGGTGAKGGTGTGGGTGGGTPSPYPAQTPVPKKGRLEQLYEQGEQVTFGDPYKEVERASVNLADTQKAFSDATRNNLANRAQTKTNAGNTTGQLDVLGNLAVQGASAGLDAATRAREAQLTGLNQLFEMGAPRTISPTDLAYSPLDGIDNINTANQGSGAGRVFNSGALAGRQAQGAQSVQFNQQQGTINSLIQSLGGSDSNNIPIVPIQKFINQIKSGTSSPELAAFQATLGSVAQVLAATNPTLAETLTNQDKLKSATPQTIISAIQAAQQAILAQQQAIQGGGQGGGTVQTTLGEVNTNW